MTDIVADQQRDEVLSRAADGGDDRDAVSKWARRQRSTSRRQLNQPQEPYQRQRSTRPPPGPRRPGTRWSVSTATASTDWRSGCPVTALMPKT